MNTLEPKQVQCDCPTHGAYVARQWGKGPVDCPNCLQEQRSREAVERLAKEKLWRCQERQSHSGLAGRFLNATFATYGVTTPAQRAVLQECERFAAEPAGALWLLGRVGVGKTHLGAAIVNASILEHDRSAKLVSARQLVRRLRDTWARGAAERESQVIDEYAHCSVLVLDELGAGTNSESEQAHLFDLIDVRYVSRLPIVIASNLNATLLRTAIGERSFDRLREGSRTLVLDWPSHRTVGTAQ